jgi:hypothetical protein
MTSGLLTHIGIQATQMRSMIKYNTVVYVNMQHA